MFLGRSLCTNLHHFQENCKEREGGREGKGEREIERGRRGREEEGRKEGESDHCLYHLHQSFNLPVKPDNYLMFLA